MKDKISLQEIIEKVLNDKGIDYEKMNDANVRRLRRAFDKLIERLGSNKEILKDSEGNFLFQKEDVPFMKIIIEQLYDENGLISKFLNKNTYFSSKDVRNLIQSIIDEADKGGASENELKEIALFFSSIFLYSPLRSKESCHQLIDALVANLEDLPNSDQSIYLGKLEHILKKEFSLRIAESTQHILAIALGIEFTDSDIGNHYYYERDPEIRFEYIERDKRVLEKIQEDADLRIYIEKKLGKKAEEIFNHAAFDSKPK